LRVKTLSLVGWVAFEIGMMVVVEW
jgi:hypothetical protein